MAVQPSSPIVRRTSIFRETGLYDDEQSDERNLPHTAHQPNQQVKVKGEHTSSARRSGTRETIWEENASLEDDDDSIEETETVTSEALPRPARQSSLLYYFSVLTLFIAISLPLVQKTSWLEASHIAPPVAQGAAFKSPIPRDHPVFEVEDLPKRANGPTSICKRWSHQSAIVNGTLYLYGGRATTDSNQNSNTWNNNLLKLDLTQSWQISSPSLTSLAQPSGPPAVANGFLWNSRSSLFLYGGEFSDNPTNSPTTYSMWEYDIGGSSWKEHQNPQTSAGDNAAGDGNPVQRSAEGAGVNAAPLGRGWYFGGHLDAFTTEGWSIQVARIYLKSLIEFTFPGVSNAGVKSLAGNKKAGSDGAWRNITEGGLQDSAGFTERADGVLLYIPGFGKEGILLGLAGGTNVSFTQMNVIDVYDVETSTWYKQATSGKTPNYRVNPCAVVAAAADGSSFNIYMFGGQNLLPYGQQTQYSDMWILSVPAFQWIEVDTSKQSVPYGRSGHTCDAWDGQMVVVGGYVGQDLSCDSPGIYVFNMSSLEWATQFRSLSTGSSGKNGNPFSQQLAQVGTGASAGVDGSYGYVVPPLVYSAIGGGPTGGATITQPIQTAQSGPLATGKPYTYTVTAPGGVITSTSNPSSKGGLDDSKSSGSKIGAIVAGIVAAIFALIAGYFAFCAWVYRKQLNLYKHHTAMTQRAAADPRHAEKMAAALFPVTTSESSNNPSHIGTGTHGSSEFSARRNQLSSSAGGSGTSGISPASAPGPDGYHAIDRRSIDSHSSGEDLLAGHEPTFWGVALNPRKSLRVINRD